MLSTTNSKPLNSLENTELRNCEKTIRDRLPAIIEVGQALAAIRDGKLYRDTHATFKAYCQERWKFSDSRARQLIGGAVRAKTVESVTRVTPSGEKQTRPLSRLPQNEQPDAWADAVDLADGAQPTTKDVEAAVEQRQTAKLDGKAPAPPKPPAGKKPARPLVGPEKAASDAKYQIGIWKDAVGRWLVSIDGYRAAYPGKQGDHVLKCAKDLFAAMGNWQKVIK